MQGYDDPLDILDDYDDGAVEMCLIEEELNQDKKVDNGNSGSFRALFELGIQLQAWWFKLINK